jgi:hypothetical protein
MAKHDSPENLPHPEPHSDVAPEIQPAVTPPEPITLERSAKPFTNDLPLWMVIRKSAQALSFNNYSRFIDLALSNSGTVDHPQKSNTPNHLKGSQGEFDKLTKLRFLPYNDTDAYRLLKVATEAFVVVNCAVGGAGSLENFHFTADDVNHLRKWVGLSDSNLDLQEFQQIWEQQTLHDVNRGNDKAKTTLYLKLICDKLPDMRLKHSILVQGQDSDDVSERIHGILKQQLTSPCLLEVIWSYWHEEAMLVQTMNAISQRFQNIQAPGTHNPLAFMEIDPLRPLNNLIWGFIQDEQHRLSLVRRICEYDHQYGLVLQDRTVPPMCSADSRSRFLESFHNLLYQTAIFFKKDDDTTFKADGFPLLYMLKEVHLVLAEGAHNQFGDLPSTARQEMLLQQWILARPEFREYIPTRMMVALPEPWMDRVDAMKTIQEWTDTSVLHFHNLAYFGEQIVLSIRHGAWIAVNDPYQAANWARFWRAELQGYIYAYRTVTGVDLTAEIADSQQAAARYMQPATHLARRLASQHRPHRISPDAGRDANPPVEAALASAIGSVDADGSGLVEIVLPRGVTLRVAGQVDESRLRSVLRAVVAETGGC